MIQRRGVMLWLPLRCRNGVITSAIRSRTVGNVMRRVRNFGLERRRTPMLSVPRANLNNTRRLMRNRLQWETKKQGNEPLVMPNWHKTPRLSRRFDKSSLIHRPAFSAKSLPSVDWLALPRLREHSTDACSESSWREDALDLDSLLYVRGVSKYRRSCCTAGRDCYSKIEMETIAKTRAPLKNAL